MDMSAANRKGLSLFALIMIGLGSIFGSGWLFGAGQAARSRARRASSPG